MVYIALADRMFPNFDWMEMKNDALMTKNLVMINRVKNQSC